MTIKINKIIIVRMRHTTDKLYLNTSLPESVFPFTGTMDLNFNCAKGTAEKYCADHFPGIPVSIVGDAG